MPLLLSLLLLAYKIEAGDYPATYDHRLRRIGLTPRSSPLEASDRLKIEMRIDNFRLLVYDYYTWHSS